MLTRPSWAPKYIELDKPDSIRIYDYLLGGSCHTAADRKVAEELLAKLPQAREIAILNRAFLRRVVRYLVSVGVRQFIDIGPGIPSVGDVHEIAQKMDPGCRVVYVDRDPIAFAYNKLRLADNALADVVQQDVRDYRIIRHEPEVEELINFDEPVAILMLMLLHLIPDDAEAARLVASYRDMLPSGSFLACSHGTTDNAPAILDSVLESCQNSTEPVAFRSRQSIAGFLSGFSIITPGVVYLPEWRPDTPEDVNETPEDCCVVGLVARK